MLTTRRC